MDNEIELENKRIADKVKKAEIKKEASRIESTRKKNKSRTKGRRQDIKKYGNFCEFK